MDIIGILQNIGFDWKVFIFNLINFLIIMALLKKFFFSTVQDKIAQRKKDIEEGYTNAQKALDDLENSDKKAQKVLDKANSEADKITAKAVQEASAVAKDIEQEAKEKAKKIIDEARDQANREREAILSEVRDNIAKLITKEVETKIKE